MTRSSRRLHPARWIAPVAVLAGLVLAPAPALAAPAVTAPPRCFIYWPGKGSQAIPITLTGLAPEQKVRLELRVRGITVSGLPMLAADSTGAVETRLSNWTSGLDDGPSRGLEAMLAVSDVTTGTELASTPVQIATAGLDIDTRTKTYAAERRWIVSGLSRLTGGPTYYAFYFKDGRQVGHQKLGPAGECGYLRTRKLLIPFAQLGTFELRVQASSKFRKSRAWAGGTVTQKRRASKRPRS
ncbi:MAG: hypothetical protein Q7T55_14200 [Solirubrobacteraceae bacterium]|nr:hypothetical protein [Solirubrobacteraceae bacterium]